MFLIVFKKFVASVCLVLAIPYLFTTIYDFPEAKKFEGKHWYNPYQNINNTLLKANFHAHSHAWAGITNGKNSIAEINQKYIEKNFQIKGVSNYFDTNQSKSYMPSYEHGFNLQKCHLLVFGNRKVNFFDFPLFQNSSHQQKIIHNLNQNGVLITLAHPSHAAGRNMKDMAKLVGYHFTEIMSHYSQSLEHWDYALASGRLSWLLVNSDSHDLSKEPIDKFFTMIYANSAKEFKENLLKGNHYGISVKDDTKPNKLKINKFEILGDSLLEVDFGSYVQMIKVIGSGVKKENIAGGKASIKLNDDYTYLRLEVTGENSTLFTNPIFKYNKDSGIKLAADLTTKTNLSATIIYRICTCLLIIFLFQMLYYKLF